MSTKKIGSLGASGYTGSDAVRLLARHPNAEITALTANTHAGKSMGDVFPHFFMLDLPKLVEWQKVDWTSLDAVLCGLPHGTTQEIIAAVLKANPKIKVLDMSADFRLRNKDTMRNGTGTSTGRSNCRAKPCTASPSFTGPTRYSALARWANWSPCAKSTAGPSATGTTRGR